MRVVQEQQNIERQQIGKQMGCMAGFFQIFERPHVLAGKRLHATKRLPPSAVSWSPLSRDIGSSSEPEKSTESLEMSMPLEKQQDSRSMPSPKSFRRSPVNEFRPLGEIQSKTHLPLPTLELKEGTKSSWKFCKESPRLSLDSRATFDATKGSLKPKEIRTNAAILSANCCESRGEEIGSNDKQGRSPSVIARLMGLELLPGSDTEEAKKPQLRRSASESRASRDLFQYRFIDGINFQLKRPQQQKTHCNFIRDNGVHDQITTSGRAINAVRPKAARAASPKGLVYKKSFDSADFFPVPKHVQAVSAYGEIERRLRMKGIEEPSKDLENLKQILEALQLKGLLRTKKHPNQFNLGNFVYDRSLSYDESPIVVMKPARSTAPMNRPGRNGNAYPPPRPVLRHDPNPYGETLPAMSPKHCYRPEIEHSVRNQTRVRGSTSRTPSESRLNSPNRRLSVEMRGRASNDSAEQRKVSPVQSPKVGSRSTGSDHYTNRSPRNRKLTVEKVFVPTEEESSTISETSISTTSQTDTERSKAEDCKGGINLQERCDKLLLHGIAELMATELQPSPVSVLDTPFYKEESSASLSPVMKRSIDFKDQLPDLEDEIWSPTISSFHDNPEHADFTYVSDVLWSSNYLSEGADVFLLLEKQQRLKGNDTSKVSTLQRKLTFDTVTEILNRMKQLPPWKAITWSNWHVLLQQVWLEFRRIRERDGADDLFEAICGMLKKDLAGDAINGWGDCPIEMSEAILDIERLIFKDLIGETIRDLAAFAPKCNRAAVRRRKLVF